MELRDGGVERVIFLSSSRRFRNSCSLAITVLCCSWLIISCRGGRIRSGDEARSLGEGILRQAAPSLKLDFGKAAHFETPDPYEGGAILALVSANPDSVTAALRQDGWMDFTGRSSRQLLASHASDAFACTYGRVGVVPEWASSRTNRVTSVYMLRQKEDGKEFFTHTALICDGDVVFVLIGEGR